MEVGVRELKAHLGAYLKRVKCGEIVTITAHGKPVARLEPMQAPSLPPHIEALWRAGRVRWSGRRARAPVGVQMTPGESIVDKIMAERERD
jgi:prevent-host-death family protein